MWSGFSLKTITHFIIPTLLVLHTKYSIIRFGGNIYWQSGRSGPLQPANKQLPSSVSQQTAMSPLTNGSKKPIKIRILTDKNGTAENKPRCGQCDKASASLVC